MDANSAYKEEPREEIIGGKAVMMAPPMTRQIRTAFNLARIFGNFLEGRTCEYFPAAELYLQEDTEEYIPDGMVVCDPEKVREDGIHGAPDLVIEVLSPGTTRYDRRHKKNVYEASGIREYWIVNPADKTVEQYLLEEGRFVLKDICVLLPEIIRKRMKSEEYTAVPAEIQCSIYDDLKIKLQDIFARVQ